jgi:predicted flap endonuclease-1-like 5' DNA nuclease
MPTWLWWFILGALVAWLIEWIIDWQYWRARLKKALTVWDSSSSMRNRLLSDPTTRRGSRSQASSAQEADEVMQLRSALAAAQQLAQQYKAELATAHADLRDANAEPERLSTQDGAIPAAEAEQLRARISELEAQLAHPPPSRAASRDTFTMINGIGPAFQKRLYDAGVCTFAELAQQTPERLRQIVRANSKQRIKPEAWIAEAQRRAQSHAREQSA